MPVADDLRAIASQAHRDLDAVHDYFEHSKFVWRSFRTFVAKGHRIVADNPATGSRLDQDGLVRLGPQYAREYLATFTFRQFVSIFEVFLFAFLHRLLLHNPWQFADRQLGFDVVLRAGSREEIISTVLLKQLNDLKYEQLRLWFAALQKAVNLGCPTDDEVDTLAEVKATRDILEHNAGVVNEIYLRKAGAKARYAVCDRVEIDDAYHLESWRLIKKVVTDVTTAAVDKLPKSSRGTRRRRGGGAGG
jgi:hypothetical protein